MFFVFRDSYVIYVRYGHCGRFAYRYGCVYFTQKIGSNSFKIEITYKVFTYKSYMYIHLSVCNEMTDVKLLE